MSEPDSTGRSRPHRRLLLHREGGWRRPGALFGVSLLFYLSLGGFSGWYDLATGVVSAAATTVVLGHVAFRNGVGGRTVGRLWRTIRFLPFLLWEIVKANVVLASALLRPSLPIDPVVTEVEVDTTDDLERAFFANCVTLTPGTVILDIRGHEYHVHALTGEAATDLASGRLARKVGEIFHETDGDES